MKNSTICIVCLFLAAVSQPRHGWCQESLSPAAAELVGRVSVISGDPLPGSGLPARMALLLQDEQGAVTELRASDRLLEAAGGARALNGRRIAVVVEGCEPGPCSETGSLPRVRSIRTLPGKTAQRDVVGDKPWVTLMCKFSDITAEPKDLAYFQGMYDASPGRLAHFWPELSYGGMTISGSTAVDWVTMAGTRDTYVQWIPDWGGYYVDKHSLFAACTAAADPYVDFSGYYGINMAFNDALDGLSWGGVTQLYPLDGVAKTWGTTWLPPAGYNGLATVCHEMGHGFGLLHSNNSDGDSDVYDNPWDVMSDFWNYSVSDPAYFNRGKHTNAYYKDQLGWIGSHMYAISSCGGTALTIDHLAISSPSNPLMVKIPIPDSQRFYMVEARLRSGDYDGNLPSDAVLVYEIDNSRTEPAWLVEALGVGSTFSDLDNQISVTVISQTATGFELNVLFASDLAGDADCSGLVDAADLSELINLAAAPGASDNGNADCNNDSSVDANDIPCVVEAVFNAVNRPPDARPDEGVCAFGATINVDVLANDTDPDPGDLLSVTRISMSPDRGTATILPGGLIRYTHTDGQPGGSDFLGYEISDGRGGTDIDYVLIYIQYP